MIKILSKELKEIIKKTKKEIKKQIIKEIKKEFLDEQIKTNQDIKDEIKKNKDLYDTKMIMFKTFGVSNDIYNEFYSYAIKMREFKNELSKIFYDHFYDILRKDFTKIDEEFNLIKQNYKNSITNSKNFQDAYRDVKAMYQSMISNNFIWSKEQETLSYLTKFYGVGLKQFLSDKESTEGLESHQSKAYKLLNYDEQKVEKIVTMRRQRMFKNCKYIEFKSLVFTNSGSINSYDNFITKYPKNILVLNKYKRQTRIQRGLKGKDLKVLKTNALIKVHLGEERYDLPIRLSDKYHTDELLKTIAQSYTGGSGGNKTAHQFTNTIQIDEFKKEIIIKFAVRVKKSSQPDSMNKVLGVDINVKNNFFYCSSGKRFVARKKLVKYIADTDKKLKEAKNNKFKKEELEIKNDNSLNRKEKAEKLNELKKKRVFNKKERYMALRNNRRKKALMDYMTSQLCKYSKSRGYDQIVIEDLQFVFSKCYITNKEFEVNYNDLFSILHLRELKHVIPRIANRPKYFLSVSITPAAYTSQTCNVCGYIDKGNRPNQHTFRCKNCGHTDNADFNAAKNIRDRITNPVLRTLLHDKQDGKQYTFEPKKIKYKQIKSKLNKTNSPKMVGCRIFKNNNNRINTGLI